MSEQTHKTSKALPLLVAALVAAVGVQAWFLAGMHRQLGQIRAAAGGDSARMATAPCRPALTAPDTSPPAPSVAAPDDDWFSRPFDPDNWDPFQEMRGLRDRMNQMFGDAFGRFHRSSEFGHLFDSDSFTPSIDLAEEKDRFVVHVDLPGADENTISVKLEGQQLTVSGSLDVKRKDTDDKGEVLRRERSSGKFSRTLTLPAPVKADGMDTRVDKGVLEITIPKA